MRKLAIVLLFLHGWGLILIGYAPPMSDGRANSVVWVHLILAGVLLTALIVGDGETGA